MTERSSPDRKTMQRVRASIIRWFELHGRKFEWRTTTDPFEVLVAEMMLRRTTASAVSRVYSVFIKRFPSARVLASASESEVRGLLDSLGLQSIRTQHFLEVGRALVAQYNGAVPSDPGRLILLPGLGRYGTSAVMNFAFGAPVPLVDGNMLHLVKRVFSLEFSGPDDEQAWRFMADFGGRTQDRRLYWGIIDLVATVCHRDRPRCESCPVSRLCDYYCRSVETHPRSRGSAET